MLICVYLAGCSAERPTPADTDTAAPATAAAPSTAPVPPTAPAPPTTAAPAAAADPPSKAASYAFRPIEPEKALVGKWSLSRYVVDEQKLAEAREEFSGDPIKVLELNSYATEGPGRAMVEFRINGRFQISSASTDAKGTGVWTLTRIDESRFQLAVKGDHPEEAHIEWTTTVAITFVDHNQFRLEMERFKPGVKVAIYERME